MKYVIVGNSAAAVGTIEGIRSKDTEGEITVFSKEPYFTYSRPLISYYLCGKTDLERMKYRPDDFYEKNKVEIKYGVEVVGGDSAKKVITASDGKTYPYDSLMLAVGGKPFVPPADGLEKNKYFTFSKLDDALELEKAVNEKSKVLIVGAGLIGLKCAEGLYGRVGEITVADMANKVLSSILDDASAKKVAEYVEKKGVKLVLGDRIVKYGLGTAETESGKKLEFDVLVIAVGVRAETSLAEKMGCETNRGIVADNGGHTTVKDVYAAGDCALSHDVASDTDKVLALLPNAYMQGYASGVNMAGGSEVFDKAVAMNSMGVLGYHLVTCGVYDGDSYVHETADGYKRLFYKDGVMKGYIMTGDVDRAGIYTALVRNRVPLDGIDFELICEKPSLMAYAKKDRARQLGGMV